MALNLIEKTYRRLSAEGKQVLKLYSGNPSLQGIQFPPDVLKKYYLPHLSTGYEPEAKGLLAAREAIARYYDNKVNLENILLTSGTSESFLHLFSLLAKPGDKILVPHPSYPLFDLIAEMTQVTLSPYHLQEDKNWDINLANIQKNEKAKAIVLISPHNPTGKVATAEEIAKIVAWANRQKIPVICDEVFSEFYFGPGSYPRVINIAKPDLCFTLNGISKMFALPGLKLSWIAVTGKKEEVAHAMEKLELSVDTYLTAHFPIQQALPFFFEQTDFMKNYHNEIATRRRLAVDLLSSSSDLSFAPPMGGFLLMAQVIKPLPMNEEEFVIRLMEEKQVFVHPGYFYDHDDGIHFVISYSTEPAILKEGVKKIIRFLGE